MSGYLRLQVLTQNDCSLSRLYHQKIIISLFFSCTLHPLKFFVVSKSLVQTNVEDANDDENSLKAFELDP